MQRASFDLDAINKALEGQPDHPVVTDVKPLSGGMVKVYIAVDPDKPEYFEGNDPEADYTEAYLAQIGGIIDIVKGALAGVVVGDWDLEEREA